MESGYPLLAVRRVQIRVLIARSHHFGWFGIQGMLNEADAIDVVGDVSSIAAAIGIGQRHHVDVVILAEDMAEGTAVETARALREGLSEVRILVIGERSAKDTPIAVGHDGVQGYLHWRDVSRETVHAALAAMVDGGLVVQSRAAADELFLSQERRQRERIRELDLTERDKAILRQLAEGLTETEIAERGNISLATLSRTIADLKENLEAETLAVLGARAVQLGLAPAKW